MKFGVLNIAERRARLPEDESWGGQDRSRTPGGCKVPPVMEAPRRVRDTGTRASAKRALSRGVEAAREGTPQSVSFDSPFQTGERELSVKIKFFIEQDENVINPKETIPGTDVFSEEERKMT